MNCSVCCEHHNVSTSFFSVFPAGAGVILKRFLLSVMGRCFPRRCGGDPQHSLLRIYVKPVFPAGAGVILYLALTEGLILRFPRRCGGDPGENENFISKKQFSPQVRG